MSERGKILYPDRKQQINDFSGLQYGRITPTDLDGVIEYQNKAYIFLEMKYYDAALPFGQRLAIERLVTDTANSGKKSIAIVACHDVFNTRDSVFVAGCGVREIYVFNEKQWRKPTKDITVKQCIDGFLKHYFKQTKLVNTS